MTPFAFSDDGHHVYSCEHSHWVESSSYATQDDQVTPLSSGDGSSNHFDTPEESMSLKMSSGSGEDDFNAHGNLDDSTNHQHASQGFPFSLETIDPALLTIRHPGSGGQDEFFTPSRSSASGMGSTQDMSQPREYSRPDHEEGMDPQLGGVYWENIDRTFRFKTCGTVARENKIAEFLHSDHVQAITPEARVPTTSPNFSLGHHTLTDNPAAILDQPSSTPCNGDFQAQLTQQKTPRSWSQHSSSTEPWTPLVAKHPQEYQPGPDEVILAPNGTPDIRGLLVAGPAEFQGREADNGQQCNEHALYGLTMEMIDEPPTGDPIGPPIGNSGNSPYGPERPPHIKSMGRHGPLDEETSQGAKIMRVKGTCWPCKLLKCKCDPSETCLPCRKARYQSKFPLGCIRDPLPDFTGVFLPASLVAQHEGANLRQFLKRHVRFWTRNAMIISVTWGYGQPIKCEVQEFEPEGDFLLFHSQYRWNVVTNKYETVRVPSPPIGIVLMEPTDWRKKFHAYLDREVEKNFAGFPERCFRGREFEVQKDIMYALYYYHVALKQKVGSELGPEWMRARASTLSKSYETITICLKLLICTHIMTRTLTLVESTKQQVYDQLLRPPTEAFGVHTSSRVLNKELKYIIAPLHQELWMKFLDQVHNTLLVGHRDKLPSWATVFGCLLTLAMTMESVQVNVRCKEATDKCDKVIPEDSNVAALDLERMEEKWEFLVSLFRRAYPRFRPIQREEHREKLDTPSQELAQRIQNTIEKHGEFLESRRLLGPPLTSQDPNNSRLVAKFLLSL